MTDERLAEIAELNSRKSYGHMESAVSHVAELLNHIQEITQERDEWRRIAQRASE